MPLLNFALQLMFSVLRQKLLCHFLLSCRLHRKTPTLYHQLIKGEGMIDTLIDHNQRPQNHNGLIGSSHEENVEYDCYPYWFILVSLHVNTCPFPS